MILLVSGQPMPNLLAALAPELEVEEAHLVVSGDMRTSGAGDRLAGVLEGRGLRVTWHDVADPFQPGPTRAVVTRLLAATPAQSIVNLTGGTKPMSLGAYRAATEAGVRDILYLDHETGLLRWLEGNRPPFPATARLRVAEVVAAHGCDVSRAASRPDDRLELARLLGSRLAPGLLEAWNRLMAAIERTSSKRWNWKPGATPVDAARSASTLAAPFDMAALETLLDDLSHRHLLTRAGNTVTVHRRIDHAFLAGGWWELLVFAALESVADRLGLHEVVRNLEVRDSAGAENEMDVAAMRGPGLLLFECKTVRLTGPDTREKAGSILYKLKYLTRLGGLGTRLFLVSRLPVEGGIRERFRTERIGLVDDVGPDGLADALAQAIRGG